MTAAVRKTFMGVPRILPTIYRCARRDPRRACLSVKDDPTCRISAANRPRSDRIWCNHPAEDASAIALGTSAIAGTSSANPTAQLYGGGSGIFKLHRARVG